MAPVDPVVRAKLADWLTREHWPYTLQERGSDPERRGEIVCNCGWESDESGANWADHLAAALLGLDESVDEWRAVWSYPPSLLGPTPARYGPERPTQALAEADRVPNSEESHGWRSGVQHRSVTSWQLFDPPAGVAGRNQPNPTAEERVEWHCRVGDIHAPHIWRDPQHQTPVDLHCPGLAAYGTPRPIQEGDNK